MMKAYCGGGDAFLGNGTGESLMPGTHIFFQERGPTAAHIRCRLRVSLLLCLNDNMNKVCTEMDHRIRCSAAHETGRAVG